MACKCRGIFVTGETHALLSLNQRVIDKTHCIDQLFVQNHRTKENNLVCLAEGYSLQTASEMSEMIPGSSFQTCLLHVLSSLFGILAMT